MLVCGIRGKFRVYIQAKEISSMDRTPSRFPSLLQLSFQCDLLYSPKMYSLSIHTNTGADNLLHKCLGLIDMVSNILSVSAVAARRISDGRSYPRHQ
jgi:hypothetical protein